MIVSAAYVGTESNGLFYIDQVSLDIHMSGLNKLILDNISDLESVEKYLNVSIRHEIGHLIDYRRFNKRPVEEYVEYFTRYNHQCDEFYRWKREVSKDDNWEDELRLYHSIEVEANADVNAGLTIEDFLSLETEKPKVNMDITLDINVIDKIQEMTKNNRRN